MLASVTEGMDMSKPSDLVQGTLDMFRGLSKRSAFCAF